MGTIFIYLVTLLVLNFYGSLLSAQIRAQTAADSAAAALVSIQSQEWDEMMILLYANDVEEYRLRNTFEEMRYAAQDQGGCFALNACDAT
jgi:hypothetical protein